MPGIARRLQSDADDTVALKRSGIPPIKGMIKTRAKKPVRQRFPEHERKYNWLSMLLDAYHINDVGIYKELTIEKKQRKQKIACHKGCHNCCSKPDVPISEIEIAGISWLSSEIIVDLTLRIRLKKQLRNHKKSLQCPFLVEGVCSIYPVRPIACREYFVFGMPCKQDEQPEGTRPHDVWSPSRNVARKTALKILPFYGFHEEPDKIRAFEEGFLHRNSVSMHLYHWALIAQTMDKFDSFLTS